MDEFQEKSSQFLTDFAKPISIGLGALILVGAAWAAIDHLQSSKEKSAQEKFALIDRKFQKIKEGFDKAEADGKAFAEAVKKDPKAAAPTTKVKSGDLEKDYGTVIPEFEAFVAGNLKSGAGGLAALTLCKIYEEYQKSDLCLAVLEKMSGIDGKNFIGMMLQTRYATALADNNQCPKARGIWMGLVKTAPTFMTQEMKLRTALCFEQEGQLDQAKALYTEIGTVRGTNPEDVAVKDADRYMRYLQFRGSGAQVGNLEN
jgi:hypothetical protein